MQRVGLLFEHASEDILTEPLIGLDQILAVQAVAMGTVLPTARTRRVDNKKYGFVLSDISDPISDDPIYDGSEQTFMGCIVKKPGFDLWRMDISFASNYMREHAMTTVVRDRFVFEWGRQTGHLAIGGRIYSEKIDSYSDFPDRQRVINVHKVAPQECDDLATKMIAFSQSYNPTGFRLA